MTHILDRIYAVIESRKGAEPDSSYVAKMFGRGKRKIAQKVGEESAELIIAAVSEKKKDVVAESADVLFHMMVLWAKLGIDPERVWKELEKREGVSGIEEKASRKS